MNFGCLFYKIHFIDFVTINELKDRIESGLPGSQVEILDPRRDGVHLEARVVFPGFNDKSLLEQHRMVYATIAEELKGELHALALQTSAS